MNEKRGLDPGVADLTEPERRELQRIVERYSLRGTTIEQGLFLLEYLPKRLLAKILYKLTEPDLLLICRASERIRAVCREYQMERRFNAGRVFTFGSGTSGKLGNGITANHSTGTPDRVAGIDDAVFVSCGGQHTAVVTKDGTLYTFGYGIYGALGDGRTDRHSTGTPYRVDTIENAVYVSCGRSHTAIVTKDGSLYTFGSGILGKLGDGIIEDHSTGTPYRVAGIDGAVLVSCGEQHTAVVTKDGTLYTFGDGEYGKLGDGIIEDHSIGTPYRVAEIEDAVSVKCAYSNTVVITRDGTLYTFGYGIDGRLGDGRTGHHATGTPYRVDTIENAVSVSCGHSHTAVVTREGSLYTFGTGFRGRLGDGRTDHHITKIPYRVDGIEDAVSVSCGDYHTAVITKNGTLYTFGRGEYGILGNGITDNHFTGTPYRVPGLDRIVSVSCGENHTAVVTASEEQMGLQRISLQCSNCMQAEATHFDPVNGRAYCGNKCFEV